MGSCTSRRRRPRGAAGIRQQPEHVELPGFSLSTASASGFDISQAGEPRIRIQKNGEIAVLQPGERAGEVGRCAKPRYPRLPGQLVGAAPPRLGVDRLHAAVDGAGGGGQHRPGPRGHERLRVDAARMVHVHAPPRRESAVAWAMGNSSSMRRCWCWTWRSAGARRQRGQARGPAPEGGRKVQRQHRGVFRAHGGDGRRGARDVEVELHTDLVAGGNTVFGTAAAAANLSACGGISGSRMETAANGRARAVG